MQPTIDPTIKALVSAIGETETGTSTPEAYTKKGLSGEYGRYQFMPDTYKARAKKFLGDENAPPTVENQNKVQYEWVKEKKAQGYSPAQIASMHNAGDDDPDAYKGTFSNGKPSRGFNSKGVQYDVPAYALKVSQAYQRLKGQQGIGGPDVAAPTTGAPASQGAHFGPVRLDSSMPNQEQTFLGDVGQSFGRAGTRLSTAIGQGVEGQINPLSATLQSAGAIAGGVGDLTSNVLEHTPVVGKAVKGLEGLIGKGITAFAGTDAGKGLIGNYQKFAEAHPEAAGNLGAAFDIATAIPVLKGLGVAKNVASKGLSTALRGGTDAVLEAVSPALGPKAQARALVERGVVKKGLLRETSIAPDPKMQELAAIVKQHVPKFDPNNLVKSVGETQKTITGLRGTLKQEVAKQGAGKIYPVKQLMARLKAVEKPDLIASDTTLNNVYDRLIKRVEGIAKGQGGKVEKLPDILSEFDSLVKRQYPNLYRSEALTPLRQGVKDMRETIKTFAEEQMPNVALKEKMLTVHKLLTAMENMAEKATKGSGKQIGTNAISRFGNKHPIIKGLVKTGTKAAVEGTGIGTMLRVMQ